MPCGERSERASSISHRPRCAGFTSTAAGLARASTARAISVGTQAWPYRRQGGARANSAPPPGTYPRPVALAVAQPLATLQRRAPSHHRATPGRGQGKGGPVHPAERRSTGGLRSRRAPPSGGGPRTSTPHTVPSHSGPRSTGGLRPAPPVPYTGTTAVVRDFVNARCHGHQHQDARRHGCGGFVPAVVVRGHQPHNKCIQRKRLSALR